jgi:uncharacterized protein
MVTQSQKDIVLAGLSAAGQNVTFTPVQTQKLFFIIDREIGPLLGGNKFNFTPYDYGPFDKAVYETLEILSLEGFVNIGASGRYNSYSLTPEGFTRGQTSLRSHSEKARSFISEAANWIKALTFGELVAAIYKQYPDMKANSIFRS